ncbi:MAG: 7TM diverse intracellular signaling domain-containing protein [Candidatus Pseudobacter hemicellulosilyticus]|uniref:histidine kinase n=1 Tax=Candidatus Pseudobacter hemicellulosilyticus TaxID=3121375 RepID=A0AAJ5WVD8_9BACT|nr:MAG: 7TM diverse intracellular signaling domain-containing protein [Pseudobacter sp.]
MFSVQPWSKTGLILLLLLCWSELFADTLYVSGKTPQPLLPFMELAETADSTASWQSMKMQPALFHAPGVQPLQEPDNYFWLRIPLVRLPQAGPEQLVSFSQLTFVDYYLCAGDSLLQSGKLGKFRPRAQWQNADNRFRFRLQLPVNTPLTLWIRVHHTKQYVPRFDFTISDRLLADKQLLKRQRIEFLLMGGMAVLFLYALLSFLVSRFRPYAWLMLFIGAMGLYTISMSGYFIDWFFPQSPATGWLFNIHLGHAGLVGMLLLILDFWQLKQRSKRFYQLISWLLGTLLLTSVVSWCLNYFWSNYNLMNTLNLLLCLPIIALLLVMIVRLWKRLDKAQLFLAYGILLFTVGGLVITICGFSLKEGSIALLPYVYTTNIILVALFFSTGLKEKLRMVDLDRKQALVLAEKNERITVLFNEVNHRVKNNLQMLYSLGDMQLPHVTDGVARAFLEDNLARIKTMMVVNRQLFQSEEVSGTGVLQLTRDLCHSIGAIYDPRRQVEVQVSGEQEAYLPAGHVLPFGLILTELLTNSYKHAFADKSLPGIQIAVAVENDHSLLSLTYADNGVGMISELHNQYSLGLELLRDLAYQLQAWLNMTGNNGFRCQLNIPLNNSESTK